MPPQAGWETGLELPFGFVASVVWQIESDDGFFSPDIKAAVNLDAFWMYLFGASRFFFFFSWR